MINLLDDLPTGGSEEICNEILMRPGVRIERIVSTGQATPADKPYEQDHDEWVLLLTGSAGLWIDEDGERMLRPGEHVLIPARRRHRVTRTATDEPTVWLTAHLHDFINAYNYGRRLKTLRGLTPYEYICKCWTNEPERFSLNPHHQMPGPNTLVRSPWWRPSSVCRSRARR